MSLATRTSRRRGTTSTSIDPSIGQFPSCFTKDLPISLCCSACKSKSDPIIYGKQSKANPKGICLQLWNAENCNSQEDSHARALILDHLDRRRQQSTAASTTMKQCDPMPLASTSTSSKQDRARTFAGYTHPSGKECLYGIGKI